MKKQIILAGWYCPKKDCGMVIYMASKKDIEKHLQEHKTIKKTNPKWISQYGVSIFIGKKKVGEKLFKNEKDMAYWLYKNKL